jgi:DTW domain-containing protein YfiP
MTTAPFEPRVVCPRCRRPERVCYCKHVVPIETRTRVVLLQHPRERDVPIGTAHMASLCLPRSELHVGVHWGGSAALRSATSDPSRPAVLLYPGPGAVDVRRSPPAGPVTLVVIDGTWAQTKKVVRENPELAALPRYAFEPDAPSEYRIRREPRDDYVSTIEALAAVLGALEGDAERFRAMLTPFRAMVDAQIEHAARLRGARVRHARMRDRERTGPRVPAIFRERAADLVCVAGEANAWPYGSPERAGPCPDELVHWVACRIATGEVLERFAAPRHALAPSTASHLRVSPQRLAAGGSLEELLAAFRAFVRDTDVVCSWGRYATALFAASGGQLPPARVDLRQVARVLSGGGIGTLEDYAARTGAYEVAPLAQGRAGVRLALLVEVARAFASA